MTTVAANGNVYSDAGESAKDMRNGGHRLYLLPMVSDVMVEVGAAKTARDAAAVSAAAAASFVGAFAPAAQAVPNMTVQVSAGDIYDGSALIEKAAQTSAVIVKPAVNPRIDRIVGDVLTGVISLVEGVEAVGPTAPEIPVGKFPICRVTLTPGMAAITTAIITDERARDGGGVQRSGGAMAGPLAVQSATLSAHPVTADQVQAQGVTAFTSAGAAPSFTLAPVPGLTAYAAGQRFRVKFNVAGNGSDTLNVSGLGAKSIKQRDSTGAKVAAVIVAGQLADVEYDGVDFVVRDPLPRLFPAGLPLDWIGLTPPPWAVVRDGASLTRTSYAALFAALCPQRSGALTNGANSVTGLATTLDMWVGMPIEGVGVPAGTTVASITSSSAITLSANATASGVQTLTLFPFGYGAGGSAATFGVPDDRGLHVRAYDSGRGYEQSTLTASTTNASNVLTGIASTRGLYVGMPVGGAGIPASTTISEILSATSAKISANATATGAAVALTVTGRQVGAEGADEIKSHTHRLQYGANLGGGQGSPGFASGGALGWGIEATGGPENNVRRRIYLPIITLGV